MSAKEMFEKLGYKKIEDNFYTCLYKKIINREEYEWVHTIKFDNKHFYSDKYISMELLQAINKQVEELGWNEKRNK